MLSTQFGDITIQVFSSGELRAFIRGRDINALREALLSASVRISALLQDIKKSGYEFDEQEVLSKGHVAQFTSRLPPGVRTSVDDHINIEVFREILYSPYELMPKFQVERNNVQAGEDIARELISSSHLKDLKALNNLIGEYIQKENIGITSFGIEQDPASQYDIQIIRVDQCAICSGTPVVNEPLCHFLRGFIRGAYSAYLELENIAVKETRCWGFGDTYCEFKMKVFPK